VDDRGQNWRSAGGSGEKEDGSEGGLPMGSQPDPAPQRRQHSGRGGQSSGWIERGDDRNAGSAGKEEEMVLKVKALVVRGRQAAAA